ncbi:glycosyltransferase [Pseudoclostridium thermosuccinogenes]|uniref:glycosyltransferase n=1 Tax=Clostridium thermosuccinogenes TaxID=84032 RepID=UPI002FD96BF8
MRQLIFIAFYPDENSIKEGMAQRVNSIDKIFKGQDRTYLQISFSKNIRKTTICCNDNFKIIKLNFFLHYIDIMKYFKNVEGVYIHSIYNYCKIMPFIKLLRKKTIKIVLDVHGAVPEELEFNKNYIRSKIYDYIEKHAFNNVNFAIFVNNAMKNHFLSKHSYFKGQSLVYSIQGNDFSKLDDNIIENLKKSLNIRDNDIVFIYSGNSQKWQNIDLMFEKIKITDNENYKFIILSKEIDYFNKLIDKYGISRQNVILRTVEPSELSAYYEISNYGFILRDDHILNKVACPTKLVEYLYYGIIPIVKYEHIGDFKQYGYEYVKITDFDSNFKQRKSDINRNIAKMMLCNSNFDEIKDLFK